jgi:hypothetical protein
MADAASLSPCLSNKDATFRLICRFEGSTWRAFWAILVALSESPCRKKFQDSTLNNSIQELNAYQPKIMLHEEIRHVSSRIKLMSLFDRE